MRNKKFLYAVMSSAVLLAAACNQEKGEQKRPEKETVVTEPATPTAEPTPTEIPYRNLGGMEIIIGYHFVPEEPAGPPEMWRDPVEEYREEIMEKYNFTIRKEEVAGWGGMVDAYIESVQAGTPLAQIFELDYRFVAEPMKKGLYYDLATLNELNFSEEKWNDNVRELMTVGDSIYGMKAGVSEPAGGVIFNKRLFEEAGLDPNLPYDLQVSGEWTWSKFEELCKILTRDTDGDGQTDVYATVSHGSSMIQTLVASAGTDFVKEDEAGMFHNNLESEEVKAAMNFALNLYTEGYEMPHPEDALWNFYEAAFQQGKGAMQFEHVSMCSHAYNYNMEDEVGFVMPPKPDGAEGYHSYFCDNVVVIPSCYDAETAGNIAYAYNLYTEMLEAEEGGEEWEEKYYSWFADERAVEETIQYFVYGNCASQLKQTVVDGMDDFLGPEFMWLYPFETVTPEEQIKQISEKWEAIIAEVNKTRAK